MAALGLVCALAAAAPQQGRNLFLLTGTCFLNDTSHTFPSRLYTVTAQGALKLFRTVVPGNEGTTEILDGMQGEIYVSFPSYTGAQGAAPMKVSVIHEQQPSEDDVVIFNPKAMLTL